MSLGPFKFPEIPSIAEIKTAIFWFLVETAASVTTLGGMFIGSTTSMGACVYIVSGIIWFYMTFKKRMWGLMPLNVGAMVVAITNLLRAAG